MKALKGFYPYRWVKLYSPQKAFCKISWKYSGEKFCHSVKIRGETSRELAEEIFPKCEVLVELYEKNAIQLPKNISAKSLQIL